jgi:histidinol-phosphate aminotransferase
MLAEIQGARFETVPFDDDWRPLVSAWPRHAHLSFLANPNSPSGTVVDPVGILRLANTVASSPLVVDEAYVDFAEKPGYAFLTRQWPNLIVTRSFSKAYSLAGIRFGFAVADPAIIRELVKVKDSYNCDVLSLAAATAAIQDQEYFQKIRDKIIATRSRMAIDLGNLGFEVTPSHANFLWCRRSDRPVKPIYEQLKGRKILVRYMNYDGYDGLRISVGTDAEIDKLLLELKEIVR